MKINDETDNEVKRLAGQIADVAEAMVEQERLFTGCALIYRKTFLALVGSGFTEEQALVIVSRQGAVKLA